MKRQARHCDKKNPKNIDAESRVDPQQKRPRRQKARGLTRFLPTVAAPKMVAETAARERRDPSTHPTVEGGIVTPRMPDHTHKISDGADEYAPPSGGAAMRQSTPAPVVALPSGGEAPAAPDKDAAVGAANEQEAEAPCISGKTIETGGGAATAALMMVKVELALAKTEETGLSTTPDEKGAGNVMGGKMRRGKTRMMASCSPTIQSVWGARV